MSIKNNQTDSIDSVLDNIRNLFNVRKDKEIAGLLGITAVDFANRKRKNTLPNHIFHWAVSNNHDLNAIFYGSKERKIANKLVENIDEWLSEIVKNEPGRETWFEYQFEDAFLGFKEWKQRKEESEGDSSEFPNSKAV